MAKEIIFNEACDMAYGVKSEFSSEEDFINEVIRQNEDGVIRVAHVKTETFFCSSTTLTGGCLIPMDLLDFVIEKYYVGVVEFVEGEDQ